MNPSDFSDPLTFPQAPPLGLHLCFVVKCLNNYWMDRHEFILQTLNSDINVPFQDEL